MEKIEKYQPSNGSEGDWFIEKHCMRCIHCNPDPSGKKQCLILAKTFVYDAHEDLYPDEWRYVDDKPTCTKWSEWDWNEKGDPDDPQNENYVMPENPNQVAIKFPDNELVDAYKDIRKLATLLSKPHLMLFLTKEEKKGIVEILKKQDSGEDN